MPTDPTTVTTWEGDLATFVRSLLSVSPAQLPDPRIGGQYDRLINVLTVEYLQLAAGPGGAIPTLEGDDLLNFNEAIGYMIAVKLFIVKYQGGVGPLQEVKVGNFDFKFGAAKDDIRTEWTNSALADLNLVAFIRQLLASENAWSFNTVQGPTRNARSSGAVRGLVDTVLDIYQDPGDGSLLSA